MPAARLLTTPLPALLYPPAAGEAPWPLVVFLHGSGERGHDLAAVRAVGLPRLLEEGLQLPAYVLAPQCPQQGWWDKELDPLRALIGQVEAQEPIDPERVSLTGLSMGGQGVWALALTQPDRFSALAPVCGRGYPARAAELAHLPAWVFHGEQDPVVPVAESQTMVDALRAAGADVRLTLYPELGHNSWDAAYGTPELLPWLIGQRRAGS